MIGAILGGASGALGGLLGSISKNKSIRKQLRLLADRERDNQNWYDRRYNEDATQRADAQRLLSMTEESIKQRNRAAEGKAAIMGGTDESVAAAKEANNRALADAASQIAVNGERRKDLIEQQYMARKDKFEDARAGLEGQKANGLDILSNTVGGAVGGIGKGLESDAYRDYLTVQKKKKEEEEE